MNSLTRAVVSTATITEIVKDAGAAGKFILDWASERETRYEYDNPFVLKSKLSMNSANVFCIVDRSITFVGHCAGAHLSMMMLAAKEVREHPYKLAIRHFFLVSGLYDLVPLLDTTVNNSLRMSR
jgi:hypothetical protein